MQSLIPRVCFGMFFTALGLIFVILNSEVARRAIRAREWQYRLVGITLDERRYRRWHRMNRILFYATGLAFTVTGLLILLGVVPA